MKQIRLEVRAWVRAWRLVLDCGQLLTEKKTLEI